MEHAGPRERALRCADAVNKACPFAREFLAVDRKSWIDSFIHSFTNSRRKSSLAHKILSCIGASAFDAHFCSFTSAVLHRLLTSVQD